MMEYSCSTYELKCNECGRRFGNRPLSGCPTAWHRSKYTTI